MALKFCCVYIHSNNRVGKSLCNQVYVTLLPFPLREFQWQRETIFINVSTRIADKTHGKEQVSSFNW